MLFGNNGTTFAPAVLAILACFLDASATSPQGFADSFLCLFFGFWFGIAVVVDGSLM